MVALRVESAAQVAATTELDETPASRTGTSTKNRTGAPPGREQRPRVATEGAAESFDGDTHSLANTADSAPLATRARRHDYAVRVVSECRDGVLVTQYMTDLPAADRKRRRTLERGLRCELRLVRIVPVGVELDTTTVPTTVVDLLEGGDAP